MLYLGMLSDLKGNELSGYLSLTNLNLFMVLYVISLSKLKLEL